MCATAKLRSDRNGSQFCIPNRAVNQGPSSTLSPVREPFCLSEDKSSLNATMQQSQHKSALRGEKKGFLDGVSCQEPSPGWLRRVSSSSHKEGEGEKEGWSSRVLHYRNRQLEWKFSYLSSQLHVTKKCEAEVSLFSRDTAGGAATAIRTTVVTTTHTANRWVEQNWPASFITHTLSH